MEEKSNEQKQEVKEVETGDPAGEAGVLKTKIGELESASGEKNRQIADLNDRLTVAIKSYKTLIAGANANIPSELLGGDTIEAIDESLARAKLVVGKIRQEVEAEAVSVRIPGGAPARTGADLSGMSPAEKIRYSINSKTGR